MFTQIGEMSDTNPLAVILVKNGSRGDKLLFRYPFATEAPNDCWPQGERLKHYAVPVKEDLQVARSSSTNIAGGHLVGFPDKVLSNLFAVKTHLCGKKFELKVNDVRFVGHPTHLQAASKGQPSSIILFNIVFALRATASHSVVHCYHDLSRRLGAALRHEERRCGYLSREAKTMLAAHDEQHDDTENKNSAFESILTKCRLAWELKDVYTSLCISGLVSVQVNKWVHVSFCLPQRVHSMHNPSLTIEPETLQKCFQALRPYHTILLLVDEDDLWGSLPEDSSPALRGLLRVLNPMKSLQQLAADADLPIRQVLHLVSHMVYWAKATLIYPLCESNVYVLSPYAPTHISSVLVARFTDSFPRISLLDILSDFSFPKPLFQEAAPPPPLSPHNQRVEIVSWLLQHRLLMQLHTYVYLVPAPPKPPPKSDAVTTAVAVPVPVPALTNGRAHGTSFGELDPGSVSSGDFSPVLRLGGKSTSSSALSDDLYPLKHFENCLPSDLSPTERASVMTVAATRNADELRLFARLLPYFRGRSHLEDIMYHENVHRTQILSMLDKFRAVLVTCQHEDTAVAMFYRSSPDA